MNFIKHDNLPFLTRIRVRHEFTDWTDPNPLNYWLISKKPDNYTGSNQAYYAFVTQTIDQTNNVVCDSS